MAVKHAKMSKAQADSATMCEDYVEEEFTPACAEQIDGSAFTVWVGFW